MTIMDRLLDKMERGELVPRLSLDESQLHGALNSRDAASFVDPWMQIFRRVENLKGGGHDADSRVTRLRELAYLQSFERWQSSDLAGYISDDFGLIGDAIVIGDNDPWLLGLLDAYLDSQFPQRPVHSRPGSLGDRL